MHYLVSVDQNSIAVHLTEMTVKGFNPLTLNAF